MKKFTKITALVVAALLALALSACGSDSGGGNAAPADSGGAAAPADSGSSAAAPATDDPPVEILFHHSGATDSTTYLASELFGQEVEKESGGNVTVKIFPTSTLLSDQEFYEGALRGRVDAAIVQVAHLEQYMPELQVLEIPGAFKGGNFDLLRSEIFEPVDRIFQKYDMKLLASFPQDTMTFAGSAVVQDPASGFFDSKTVRVSGSWAGKIIEKWGGAPVNIPMSDLTNALERNTVNMALSTWIMIDGYKLYEPAPHVTMTNLAEIYCGIGISMAKWESLTPNQQAAVERAAATFETEGIKITNEKKQTFLDTVNADPDVEVYTSTDEDWKFYNEKAWELIEAEIMPGANEDTLALIEVIKKMQ